MPPSIPTPIHRVLHVSLLLVAASCGDSSGGGSGGGDAGGTSTSATVGTTTATGVDAAGSGGGAAGEGGAIWAAGGAPGFGGNDTCGNQGGAGGCDDTDSYRARCEATCEALATAATDPGCTDTACPESCDFRSAACETEHLDVFACLTAAADDEAGCACGEDGTLDCSALCSDAIAARAACTAPIEAACAAVDEGLVASGCGGYGENCTGSIDQAIGDGCSAESYALWACYAENIEDFECTEDGYPDDDGLCPEEAHAESYCRAHDGQPDPYLTLDGCELEGAIVVTPSELSPTDGCEAFYACDGDVALRVFCDGENDGTGTSLCECHIGSDNRYGGLVDGEGEDACLAGYLNCLDGGVPY